MNRGVKRCRRGYRCARCGVKGLAHFAPYYDAFNGEEGVYCRNCTEVVQSNTLQPLTDTRIVWQQERWNYSIELPLKLSAAQRRVVNELHAALSPFGSSVLLHAVCGAGKTEIAALICADFLRRGEVVGWAIPRRDVVIELSQRLRSYFPQTEIVALYQDSEELYKAGQLTILTTARLRKLYRSFDFLVVDEHDAYPFSVDGSQQQAAVHAVKVGGKQLFVSATVKRFEQYFYDARVSLSARFHGGKLPLPIYRYMRQHYIGKRRWERYMQQLLATRARCSMLFVYVSSKQLGKNVLQQCIAAGGFGRIAFVASDTSDRSEIISALRGQQLDVIITTTILERGVTFPRVGVVIFDADHAIFDAATLIQVSGRVGRSASDPTGVIEFWYSRYVTDAMVFARKYTQYANLGRLIYV